MASVDFTIILFGIAAVVLTAAATLSLLVRRRPGFSLALVASFGIAFVALAAAAALDVAGPERVTVTTESTRGLSLLAATHRRLLMLLPLTLSATAVCVLCVYHDRLAEKHARDYRNAISFFGAASLLATVLIAVEASI